MDYFYDGQIKRFLAQFMRAMSNFAYKDAKGQLTRIPVRYGDMNRQVSSILKKNSENTIPSAPFMACYIKDVQFDRSRLQDPTFVSKLNIRERAIDPVTGNYTTQQGAGYTIERIMPAPYLIDFALDLWTTSTDQKLQIFEQLSYLFRPSIEIQTTDNYVDWTSINVLTLKTTNFSSRSIPQGLEQDIDILNMVFEAQAWITPPAKVKQLGVVTKIITNAFTYDGTGEIFQEFDNPDTVYDLSSLINDQSTVVVTPGNFDLMVLNNIASLVVPSNAVNESVVNITNNNISWHSILDLYPGQFRAGLSQLRLTKPDGNSIVAYISINPANDSQMMLNIDVDTIPSNTVITSAVTPGGRGTIDAIINPETFNPKNRVAGTRYLILEDVNIDISLPGYNGPVAWKNSDNSDPVLHANDIIEWSGTNWVTVFNSLSATSVTYITNTYTGIQYKWDPSIMSWSKSFEGVYDKINWSLVL